MHRTVYSGDEVGAALIYKYVEIFGRAVSRADTHEIISLQSAAAVVGHGTVVSEAAQRSSRAMSIATLE